MGYKLHESPSSAVRSPCRPVGPVGSCECMQALFRTAVQLSLAIFLGQATLAALELLHVQWPMELACQIRVNAGGSDWDALKAVTCIYENL